MSTHLRTSTVYEFDDVTIDCRNFQVWKNGEAKHLTPKAFEVLIFLLENCGLVVSKDELFRSIWKENFVTDNALTRMIKEIRQVLGDDADVPRYIETLSKRGYRFIAKIKSSTDQRNNDHAERRHVVPAIAVLPFSYVGAEADGDFLSEAITESLINNLSKLSDIRVIPRSLVIAHQKGEREVNLLKAGMDLNAQWATSGRVLQRNDNLIVSAELISVETEAQIWGEKYQYKIDDIFQLQKDISLKISTQLQEKLIPEKHQPPTRNAEAYLLYLKGRYFWNRRPQGLALGIKYFEQSVARDEHFALGYAGLADSYSTLGSWENGGLPPNIAMPKARASAVKALQLDPSLAEAHTTLAYTKLHYEWDFFEAEQGIKRALVLDNKYVHAHHWLSHIYMAQGETEKSLTASLHAFKLDPLDLIINVHLAWHHWLARNPDEAIKYAEKTRELDPHVIWASYFAGLALEEKGMYEAAAEELRRAHRLAPQVTLVRSALGSILGYCGETKAARKILLELEKQRSKDFVPAYDIAIVRLGLGEKTAALEWLNKAAVEHSGWLAYLKVEPRLDSLRSTPEFKSLIAHVGL